MDSSIENKKRKKNAVLKEDNLSKDEKILKVVEEVKAVRKIKGAVRTQEPPKSTRFTSENWTGCPGGISKLRQEVSDYLVKGVQEVLDKIKYLATSDYVPPDVQLKACVEYLNRCVGRQSIDVAGLIDNNFDINRSTVRSALAFVFGEKAPNFLENLNKKEETFIQSN